MASEDEYSIPKSRQPDPASFEFDLLDSLNSIVTVKTQIPEDALTASVLGTEREGHGVVINDKGLVLTIGYVITEAESVWLVDHTGATVQGHVIGYDQESGFGLVQSMAPLDLPSMSLGRASEIHKGERMVLAGAGGLACSIEVSVVSIREFAGYWEYLLDKAFFTAPAHPSWGGAALLGEDGKLYGIGSLVIQTIEQSSGEAVEKGAANMVIPIDLLPPILDELLQFGQRNKPSRPWIGWYTQETSGGLIVAGVVDNGPANQAGIQSGDLLTEINGISVVKLADLYRAVWASGDAGVDISVAFKRDSQRQNCTVSSIDRTAMMARQKLH